MRRASKKYRARLKTRYRFNNHILEVLECYVCRNINLTEGIQWNCDENQNVLGIYKSEDTTVNIKQYGH